MFARPDTPLELHASLLLLERRLRGLHVGGKSALDWHGVRHNVAQQPVLQLYGWASGPLPPWFATRFPSAYHRLRRLPTGSKRTWVGRSKEGLLVLEP